MPPSDGEYTFFLNSNDGSDLQIGDTVVVDNDGQHDGRVQVSGNIGLEAGLHALQIRHFQSGGTCSLIPRWEGPSISKAIIPASVYRYETSTPVVNTPPIISLDTPSNGAVFPANNEVRLQVRASDNSSVVSVEFFVNSDSIGIDTTGNPYAIDWTPTILENYTVSARATNNLDVSSDSLVVGVTVVSGNEQPPVIDDDESLCMAIRAQSGTVSVICL